MMFWNLLICVGVLWIIQSFFSFIQGLHIKNTLHALSDYGKVFMGKTPGFFQRKVIVFTAVDSQHCIVKANKLLTAGAFGVPKVFEFNELSDLNITNLRQNQLGLDKNTDLAVTNLVKNYASQQSK